jgi:hypothetical protein
VADDEESGLENSLILCAFAGDCLNVIFIVGMAGSGKSLLAGSMQEWLRLRRHNVSVLNLDPGVENLPYNPDVDVRTYVDIRRLMIEYQLGPNGALVMASDLIGEHIEEIREELEETAPDILFVDTPGQIELFAFRESGPFVAEALGGEREAILYLFDAPFCRNPMNYVSNMFLATAVHSRLLLSQSCAFTKTDLITQEETNELLERSESIEVLNLAIQQRLGDTESILIRDLAESITRSGLSFSPIPVSAKKNEGLVELYAELTRSLLGGEEPTA